MSRALVKTGGSLRALRGFGVVDRPWHSALARALVRFIASARQCFLMRDGAVERWMAIEMARLRDALVTNARPVGDLIVEAAPTAPTKGGGVHVFDKDVVARVHAALSPLERRRVKLPITFFVESDLPDDAFVADAAAIGALRALGEVADREPREGRLWVGHARARALAARYPTAFQFAHL